MNESWWTCRSGDSNADDFSHINLHAAALRRVDGTPVTLRRFLGRWAVVVVEEDQHRVVLRERPEYLNCTGILLRMGEFSARSDVPEGYIVLHDPERSIASLLPDETWPATLLVDASGRLVDVVHLRDMASVETRMAREGDSATGGGAVDQGDYSQ